MDTIQLRLIFVAGLVALGGLSLVVGAALSKLAEVLGRSPGATDAGRRGGVRSTPSVAGLRRARS
jgi:hypothetical protein